MIKQKKNNIFFLYIKFKIFNLELQIKIFFIIIGNEFSCIFLKINMYLVIFFYQLNGLGIIVRIGYKMFNKVQFDFWEIYIILYIKLI